jgi:hypothetical protein
MDHINYLGKHGVDKVFITSSSLEVQPEVKGIQTAKLLDENWVSKLSFNRLKNTVRDAAALGQASDTHSTDPIAPYLLGVNFGEGQHGKY